MSATMRDRFFVMLPWSWFPLLHAIPVGLMVVYPTLGRWERLIWIHFFCRTYPERVGLDGWYFRCDCRDGARIVGSVAFHTWRLHRGYSGHPLHPFSAGPNFWWTSRSVKEYRAHRHNVGLSWTFFVGDVVFFVGGSSSLPPSSRRPTNNEQI